LFYRSAMPFVEMDPAFALAALEGYQDELSSEKRANDAFYRQFRCPRCGGECSPEYSAQHAFGGGAVVPRALLRCLKCRGLMDPHSGLQVELGNLGEHAQDPVVIKPER
jgi:hypothetical protein